MKRLALAALLCVAVLASGCASIVSKSAWPVTIVSNPSGQPVKVKNQDGQYVHEGITPFTVTLEASAGYFDAADYTLESGYGKMLLSGNLNGWYWGNIIFGGALGLLIVDPLTGAMFRMDDIVDITPAPVQP